MSTAKFSTWLNPDGTENYKCRAWVNFNGTGTVAIRAAGNVASITDNGTGNYTVNFTTALPDANYSTVLSRGALPATGFIVQGDSVPQTASSVRISAVDHTNSAFQDTTNNFVAIFR